MLPTEDRIKLRERLDHGAIQKIAEASGKSYNTVTRWFKGVVVDSPSIESATLEYFSQLLDRHKESLKSAKNMVKQYDAVEHELEQSSQ